MRDQLAVARHRVEHIQQELSTQIEQVRALRDGLLKTVDDALLIVDSDYRILFANPAAETMLGQELVGETLIGAVRHPEMELLMQDAQLVRGESVERRIEWERHILMVRAMAHQDGEHSFQILTLRDVTEFQRLERARREMVSNISHELSTPITAIGLLADTLLDSAIKDKPKRTRKLASDISREVETLTQLVQEMRDLSLIESGQMPVRLTPTDLHQIVDASVQPLLPLAENKTEIISTEIATGISVLADEVQLQRAIKNIVHNAVKYSPAGSKIEISATTNGDEAVIAVKDHGPGIPRDDLERIFERFFQVDRSRRSGTGLGLAIVRHIVLAHGGRVWVESDEGHGATFYISLVLAEPVLQNNIILG
jgi:PAS domain S-box-containing protein